MTKFKINPIKTPSKILNYWKNEKLVVFIIFFSGIICNTSIILGPIYQGKLIDSLINGSSLDYVIKLGLTFIFIVIAIQLMRYFKRFYIRRFANSSIATMRLIMYNNIMHKDISELEKDNTGNLMTRAISDVDSTVEGMRKFTTEIFDTGVVMTTYLVSLLFYDIKTTIFSCIFIPIAMILAEKLKKIIYKYNTANQEKNSEVAQITYDLIENSILYRVNSMEQKVSEDYNLKLAELQNTAIKANIFENSMPSIYNVIAGLGIIIVIISGGSKVIEGSWSIGMFSTYITIFTTFAVKASKAAKLFNSVQKSQISWKRIKPYLSEYKEQILKYPITDEPLKLEIKNLGFHYHECENNVIENISFSGLQGEIIGVTGSIACGKSTLGLSLTGLYPYLGSIKINNIELNDYSQEQRNQMISYLGHNPQLLSDTIYNNITLGSNKNITQVLRDVCFDTDLEAMPNGQNTMVGNGGFRLSGGQQARIALARALLNKNKIIILDDPFSAVDMKTEEQIIQNLRNNYKNSLIILISHRLTIFSKTNKILLLKNGKTAALGTHNELMKSSEIYSKIYKLQCMESGDKSEKQPD